MRGWGSAGSDAGRAAEQLSSGSRVHGVGERGRQPCPCLLQTEEMMLNVPSLPLQSFSPAQLPEAHKSCHFLLLKHSSLEVFASPFKI